MGNAGILIEIENNTIKETSLGVMTAAAGQEIYALVLGSDATAYKDKLSEYGAAKIISITATSGVMMAS